MNGDEVCTCGDVADEHSEDSPRVCEVEDCDCRSFEEDEEATAEARDGQE